MGSTPERTGASTEEERPVYRKPQVQDYGRIEPRLAFSPPDPPP